MVGAAMIVLICSAGSRNPGSAEAGTGAPGTVAGGGGAGGELLEAGVGTAGGEAAARSRPQEKRCAGSLAIAVAITASMRADSPGAHSLTLGGGACRCAATTAAMPWPHAKGALPVSIRNRVHPKEYRSARPSNG